MSQPGDDAQRDLEQRALRNVRGLLDKVEDQDRKETRTTLRIAVACGILVVAAVVVFLVFGVGRKPEPTGTIVIPPAKISR